MTTLLKETFYYLRAGKLNSQIILKDKISPYQFLNWAHLDLLILIYS